MADPKQADPNNPPLVLVVDDDALLRWHAADVLVSAGYKVVEADDAATALRIIEQQPEIRVLFTDIQMPGQDDGLQLAAKVHERWPHVLLIVTSGQLQPAGEEIPDHGRFVAKPYRADALLKELGDMIGDEDSGALGQSA